MTRFLALVLAVLLAACAPRVRSVVKLVLNQPAFDAGARGISRLAVLDLRIPPSLGYQPAAVASPGAASPVPAAVGAAISDRIQAQLARQLKLLAERRAATPLAGAERQPPPAPGTQAVRLEALAQQLGVQAFLAGQLRAYGVKETVEQHGGEPGYRVVTRRAEVAFDYQVVLPGGEAVWTRTVNGSAEASWLDGAARRAADRAFIERLATQGKRILDQRQPDSELLSSAIDLAVIDVIRDIAPYYTIEDEEIL